MSRLSELGRRFFAEGKLEDCPIIDVHGHMGPTPGLYLSVTDARGTVQCMDRAGVRLFLFCYHSALGTSMGNTQNIQAVREFPDRLRAYCGVNPNFPETLVKDIETFDSYGDVYVGFKFLSDYHGRRLSDDGYRPAWELADARGLLVLLHTWGGSTYDGYEEVRKVAERYTNARIIVGHSIHGDWDHAIEIVRSFPNTYLEICAVVDEEGVLEKFVDSLGSDRILFGTDFPWFDFHYYIGAVLGARISDEDRRNILYRNARKLVVGSESPLI